jgi:hypothetical protein
MRAERQVAKLDTIIPKNQYGFIQSGSLILYIAQTR